MAEIKTGIFAKNVQKRLNRAQEKVLQKLGKADETKDEQFEQTVQNFKRQESEGSRLQRELRAYLAAVKGMQQASMNLTESLHEVYEPDWHGKDDVMTIGKNCDELWEDFHERLVDSTVNALENYLVQFPDLKTRVSKRARKLIDYDSARHHLETLQASNMRSERKTMKAEEDLKKAQKVFDDLNVGLQDELPTLWDSRVGFYVNTFKSITSLEAKFHREISLLCHKLYEVMNRLAEQHSDKMFTIQGAPSDSGPLRLARTPSPPDDSPPESPDASPNHMLRPTSPGPPRPKSPSQLKKGPPVRPPPMVTPTPTPTKEIQQEQIIDLFDSAFPVPAPCTQPNERPGESLLDLDFDAFPTTPAGQSTSQNLPWDMWTGNAAAAQPQQLDSGSWAEGAASQGEGEGEGEASASANSSLPAFPDQAADTAAGFGGGAGFTADWSANFAADFGASAAGTEGADPFGGAAADPFGGAAADPFAGADGAAAAPASDGGWPPASGWGATEATQPPAAAAETAGGDEVSVQGLSEQTPEPNPERDPSDAQLQQEQGQGPEGAGAGWAPEQAGWGWAEGQQAAEGAVGEAEGEVAVPGIMFTNEYGQAVQEGAEDAGGDESGWGRGDVDADGSEYETAEELDEVPGHNGGWVSADDELAASAEQGEGADSSDVTQGGFAEWGAPDAASPFPEQAPVADVGFAGEGFAVQWDQPAATEPVPVQQNTPESAPQPGLDITEPAQGSDPFGSDGDPFGTESDPFGTGEDPFATSADPFGTSETDPFATSDKDPFADAEQDLFANEGAAVEQDLFANQGAAVEQDLFANQGADAFASQAPAEAEPVGFTSDPFAESSAQGGSTGATADGGWAADPFATDTANQGSGWPGGWESSGGSGGGGGEGQDSAQWAAFPIPGTTADADSSSKGSWQEVSDSSGFFSSDGQGDFTAGWGADAGSAGGAAAGGGVGGSQPQDFFAAFPSPGEPAAGGRAHVPREPENSDLSEDEVANRRYGKLYQEIDTEKDEVANNAFNGFPQTDSAAPAFAADFDKMAEGAEGAEAVVATEAPEATEGAEGQVTTPPAPAEAAETAETVATSPPGEKAPTPAESPVSADNVEGTEGTEIPAPDEPEKEQPIHEAPESAAVPEAEESPTAEAPASPDDKGSPIEEAPAEVAKPAGESGGGDGNAEPEAEPQPKQEAGTVEVKAEEAASAAEAKPVEGAADSVSEEEKMPIPSVVIEPASSNEGDDDRDVDILSPTTTSDNGVPPTSDAPSGMPPGFLYKVEAMHDFDAENTDELNLKQGDMVLVVPTSQSEDQDAGWLTGMREVDWHQQGALAKKGLFPENFVQRVD
ncbi:hypothetical protein AALO_G00003050 [Alosa alosa]|uniref:Amphiphysin n=1 Tax=Alosa alosa TaxID=278164 RepID=A0AAV6HDN8_9TELE|nr:hypothetical protein AALO_G00003050 [Alosa alosa]